MFWVEDSLNVCNTVIYRHCKKREKTEKKEREGKDTMISILGHDAHPLLAKEKDKQGNQATLSDTSLLSPRRQFLILR